MEQVYKKSKREKKNRLYSKYYPHQNEIDYDEEQIYFKNMIWSILKNNEFIKDKQIASVNLKCLLKKFKSIYFLTHQEKEMIASILFENCFTLFYINIDHRIEFMKLLNLLLKTKKKFKNLVINWKILHHFFIKQYKSNEIFVMQGEEILLLQLQEMVLIIKRCRKYFDESSIDEVYHQMFKKNFNPSEFSLGISLLAVFLKTDSKTYDYSIILDELIEYIFYRFNQRDTLFMFIIKEIIWNQNNRIDFSIYYERLFYIILNHINNILRNDFSDEEFKDEKLFEILLNDPVTDIKSTFKSIPDIIIGLLVPSDNQHFETVWSYIERIFNLIDSLLNPSSQQDWSQDIFKFLKYFVRKFIKRYTSDSKKHKKQSRACEYTQSEYSSDSNSDSVVESDSSDIDDIGHQSPHKKIKTSQNSLLDEPNKEKFMSLILKLINKLIFCEDNGYALAKIFLYLSYFDPIRFYPVFFESINRTLESDHKMSYVTVKNCFLLQISPLILTSKFGIQKCFQFFQQSFKFFKNQGLIENLDLIEIYNKFLYYFPVKSYQELAQEFELQNEISEDQIQLLKDIEKWILDLFELIVNNLEFLEFQQDSEQMCLVMDIQNLFKTIVIQCSNQLRNKFIDMIFARLETQIFKQSSVALSYILNSYSLVEPEMILKKVFSLLMRKIIKPRSQSLNSMESLDKIKKHPLYFIIENLPNCDEILSFEIEIQNNDSLIFYLELLENSITYANKYLIPYDKELQIIIFLLIFEEENFIFEKSCDLLHTLLISLINDYIIDQYYINDDEKNLKQNQFLYIKKGKKSDIFNLKPIWNNPGEQERLYTLQWVQRIIDCIINYYNQKYFDSNFKTFDYKIEKYDLINKLIFNKPEENTQKKEFYRTNFLIISVISAINWKIPFFSYYKNDEKNSIYMKFEKTQMFSEYDGYRDKLLQFLFQISTLFFQKDMFHDNLISQTFHLLLKEIFFDNFPIDEVKKSKEQIEGINAIENQFWQRKVNIRFYQLIELSSKYQERTILYLFTFFENCGFPDQIENLLYLEFILGFNPIYSLKHTFFYHYQSLNEIFHEEHITMLELFHDQLSSGILKRYNESPIYEKGIQFIIMNIKRIKLIWNQRCCPYDTRLIERLQKILSMYGLLEQKALKELFLDPFLKLFTHGYQDSQFIGNQFYIGNSIIKSNNLYNEHYKVDHALQFRLTEEQKQFYRQHLYSVLEKLSDCIEDQQTHWKLKTTYVLLSMCLLNNFDKLSHYEEPVIIKLLEQFIQFSISDNIHLQQLGRSSILRTLNRLKRIQIFQNPYQDEIINQMNNDDQSRSLEEFLKWHFLKKEFLNNNAIHCKYQGFFGDLDQNKCKKNKQILLKSPQIQSNKFIITLKKYFCDQNFMEKFIKNVLLDKNLSINSDNDDDALHQQIEENGSIIFNHLQILFLFFYDKDLKKFFSFSSSYALIFSEFYQKFFKKLFQFFDDDFFQSTSKIIENCFSSQVDQRENQKLTLYYISALLKTMSKQQDAIVNNEFNYKRYEIIYNYANKISLLAIAQSNQEFFREWLECFSYFARNNDIRITEYFFQQLIVKSRSMNQTGLRFRYYQIIKEFIKQNSYRSRKIAFEALQNIQNDYQINDKTECDEITDLIVHILSYAICIPLNYKKLKQEQWIEGGVQQYIDSKQLFVLNDTTLFENNQIIKGFFQYLIQKLKHEDDEESLKLYQYLAFQIMETLIIKRQNDLFWSYFQDLFDFLMDNQMVDIDEKQILKKISDSQFPHNLRILLTENLNLKIETGSWAAKQKCLHFSREFFFYKHFLTNSSYVDSVFLKAFLDDNQTIQINSIKSLADVLKISKDEEFQTMFDQYSNSANIELPIGKYVLDYKNNIIIKKQGLYVLMSLILATQDRVFKWIQVGLDIILKNQKLSQAIKKTTQDFFSLYWQNKQENINFDQLGIQNEMIEQIKEVANPYSYFS